MGRGENGVLAGSGEKLSTAYEHGSGRTRAKSPQGKRTPNRAVSAAEGGRPARHPRAARGIDCGARARRAGLDAGLALGLMVWDLYAQSWKLKLTDALKPVLLTLVCALGLLIVTSDCARAQSLLNQPFVVNGPVHLSGETLIYDARRNQFVVSGHARLLQGARLLTAHQIEFEPHAQKAAATGNVHLTDPQAGLFATCAHLDMGYETGTLKDARVKSRYQTFKAQGKLVRKLEGQHYLVTDSTFTACQCGEGPPAWSISAADLDVTVPGTATARGTQFNILGHPVLPAPLPEAWFPVGVDRSSGLLSPQLTQSNFRGEQLLQPYYFNINRSSDATVALDVETSQRVGGYGEYRIDNGTDDYLWVDGGYFNESIRSNANRESSIFDSQIAENNIPENRMDFIGMMRQHLGDDLTLYGDGMTVSDALLLRDLDVWTLSRDYNYGSGINLLRYTSSDLGMLYDYQNGYAQVQSQWFQDLIQDPRFALQVPFMGLVSGFAPLPGNLVFANYDVQLADFWRLRAMDSERLNIQPAFTLPFRWSKYLTAFATVGMYDTFYDVSGHNVGITPVGTGGRLYNNGLFIGPLGQGGLLTREPVPYVDLHASTILGRVFDTHFGSLEKLRQTIEPFVDYAYVPNMDQGNLPLFDEIDRVEGRSLITYGFSTRILAKLGSAPPVTPTAPLTTSQTALSRGGLLAPFSPGRMLGVGSLEDLADITVMQSYDTSHVVTAQGAHLSDLSMAGSFLPTRLGWFSLNMDYNVTGPYRLDAANFAFNFQPPWEPNVSPVYMGHAVVGSYFTVSYSY